MVKYERLLPFFIILILCISLYFVKFTADLLPFSLQKVLEEDNQKPFFSQSHSNPPCPHLSDKYGVPPEERLYIIIIDESDSPQHYHCLMKQQWINSFLKYSFIDGIEFYSFYSWKNKECNIFSVQVPPPSRKMADYSTWKFHKALQMSLNRTDSGFFFVITDATYINTEKFMNEYYHLTKHLFGYRDSFSHGCCVERRYFFDLLKITSGTILSRLLVENLLNLDWKWKASIDLELPAEESLGQILDTAEKYVPHQHMPHMLGAPFELEQHYHYLMTKKFDNLTKCFVSEKLKHPDSGKNGVCSPDIDKINDIIAWAGYKTSSPKDKQEFLENVDKYLQNVPDNIGYFWNKYLPFLCRIEP